MLDAKSNSGSRTVPELNSIDGTIVRDDPRSETYDYRVDSGTDPEHAPARRAASRAGAS